MKSIFLKTAVAAVLLGASGLAISAPPDGKGPPEGHGPPVSEVGNNLSVPAIMAGGTGAFENLNCSTAGFTELAGPNKDPVWYPSDCAPTQDGEVCVDEGFYYLQANAVWQAPCFASTSIPVSARGAWGDNMTGDAKLKVGSPIRVEIVLWEAGGLADGELGFYVTKLQPEELDRESDYGHLASGEPGTFLPITYEVGKEYLADADPVSGEFVGVFGAIVHDPDATLTIEKIVDGNPVSPAVFDGEAGGEINATGKIVYGYNLRVSEAGTYRITYTLPNISLTGCDAGDCTTDATKAVLEIAVIGGGGGKKGGN